MNSPQNPPNARPDLTPPALPEAIYAARRASLMEKLGNDAVAIIPTSSELLRNADTHFRFRPDSDFHYLTGYTEPDAVLILAPHHASQPVVLFVRPKDPAREVWTGRRAGIEGALERFGAHAAYPIAELETRLPQFLEGANALFYRPGLNWDMDKRVLTAFHSLRQAKRRLTVSPTRIVDTSVLLHEMRLRKTPQELELMRRAADISVEAHKAAMAFARPGRWEFEVEALVEYTFRKNGAGAPGYPSIVGAGENATILHYVENNCILKDGDLLLIDAGAEFHYYTADITRTFPINGRFTSAQKDVYAVVLEAQKQAIDAVRPGLSVYEAHYRALRVLTEGLVSLGILTGSVESLLEQEAYLPYYMHRTGHYLGMDVHDAGDYVRGGAFRPLEPGMVVTVEPGLYFGAKQGSAQIPGLPEHFRGIGVRIEDDVLCTPDGFEVLTQGAPKEIADLESLVGSAG